MRGRWPSWNGRSRLCRCAGSIASCIEPSASAERLHRALTSSRQAKGSTQVVEPWTGPYRSHVSRRSSGKCRSSHSRLSGLRDPPSCLGERGQLVVAQVVPGGVIVLASILITNTFDPVHPRDLSRGADIDNTSLSVATDGGPETCFGRRSPQAGGARRERVRADV